MEPQLNHAFSVAHEEGKAYWFDRNLMEIKATGAETNDVFSLIEGWHPVGYETPLHLHRNEEESLYVLEGEVIYTIGEKTMTGKAGTFFYVPRNMPHKFKVVSADPARTLTMLTPAKGLQFYIEAAVEADERKLPPATLQPDIEKMMAASQKYGVEVVE
ncbi:cupin domain-containing protein [Planococcus shixiaomingii]|uniref:cupin domain-containing protein n=1 Tax=Planococcus shixiaomingii TaxID=3058393 RepID=UPI00261EA7FF|nr:cupin domain-containing protein [Planococcus sp. N022]WKA55542.1 cupin domain-containing protein [Planococcus sp. N022]